MLFGLGFETATEVALLANAARDGANGLAISTILLYPCLFMAGMLAIDSMDGLLMLKAFNWFKGDDIRRSTYNTVISLMTGTVALVIAVIQSLSLLRDQELVNRVIINVINAFTLNTEVIGMSIAGVLLSFWIGSMFIHYLKPKRFLN
jgi:high-affinity nickel-transport protein